MQSNKVMEKPGDLFNVHQLPTAQQAYQSYANSQSSDDLLVLCLLRVCHHVLDCLRIV